MACDSSEPEVGEAVASFKNYQETGDLDALREHGYIRLLAPRFDDPAGLPRDGIPASQYQVQAEAFVESLGLQPRWVYADNFDELGALLNAGDADNAKQYLDKAGTSADAQNARGVYEMLKGNEKQARYYLEQAAKAGVASAKENLQNL